MDIPGEASPHPRRGRRTTHRRCQWKLSTESRQSCRLPDVEKNLNCFCFCCAFFSWKQMSGMVWCLFLRFMFYFSLFFILLYSLNLVSCRYYSILMTLRRLKKLQKGWVVRLLRLLWLLCCEVTNLGEDANTLYREESCLIPARQRLPRRLGNCRTTSWRSSQGRKSTDMTKTNNSPYRLQNLGKRTLTSLRQVLDLP